MQQATEEKVEIPRKTRSYPAEEKRVPANNKEFFLLYQSFVRERVRRYNRGQVTPSEMEDIFQSIWVRFFEYGTLEKYHPSRGTFPGYLGTAVYNASWNLRRARKKRDREKPLKNGTEESPDDPRSVFEEILCTDDGRTADLSQVNVELKMIDTRLARFFSDSERLTFYEKAAKDNLPLEDVLLCSGLDPEQLSYIFEEVL